MDYIRKRTYFVSWVAPDTSTTQIGNNIIYSKYKGELLLAYIIEEIRKENPRAVVMHIQKLD